jgi:alpha-glucosidase
VTAGSPWWQGAVIYQVYIRSFCDSDGDGFGDFAGVISKLDYIAGLGVDAIWLSPVHPSPDRDWGYDVSDYSGVHKDYGTQADFDRLLAEAHARGLKVMTDEVLAHTSDEHAWFQESVRGGAKTDWYVWAAPKHDGTAPNNWLSAFGGTAWAYQPAQRKHYHHKFLRQQPKLNWRNAETKAAALAVLDEWLARGVDGFRLDVANAYLHDAALTDNPAVAESERDALSWSHAANLQRHYHDANLPENIEALAEVRAVVERHADRFVMGEFSEEPERCGCFAAPDVGLHSGYSFPLLEAHTLGPEFIRKHFAMLAKYPKHWPSVAFSNHDIMRTVTRFGGPDAPPALAKLMFALLLSLKGTALIYQGEELGLPQADIRRDQLRDPVGDLYYPWFKGRDGCRTPMPWNADAANLGFTSGKPWLPMAPAHKALAVSAQDADKNSMLAFARDMIALRKKHPALVLGEIELLDAPAPVLAFRRTHGGESVLCVFNMSKDEVVYEMNRNSEPLLLMGAVAQTGKLQLAPFGFWLAKF